MGIERAVCEPSKSIDACPCERQHIRAVPKHYRPYLISSNLAAVDLNKDIPTQSLVGVLK